MTHFGDDWFNDYMEMKIALGEDDDSESNESNGGNNGGCLSALLGFLTVVWFISLLGKLF